MSRRKRALVLSLAPLLCALPALSQSREVSVDQADGCTLDAVWLERKPAFVLPTSSTFDHTDGQALTAPLTMPKLDLELNEALLTTSGDDPKADSSSQPPTERLSPSKPRDFNRDTYYKNKLEFSFDAGWLPINIPFPLDFFVGDAYNTYPLKYTLVPMIASLRWHLNDVGGPRILRGNFDLTFSLSVTAIPRGPESRYLSYIMGIRRNFVPRNSKVAPYFDMRFGIGNIDAKGPEGVPYAQGQDTTFTIQMGSGVRYNFNPRVAISGGLNFMHISNMDLSERNYPPYGIYNYGINVYGPMVGIDILLGKHPQKSR
jgi:hypothetical protein